MISIHRFKKLKATDQIQFLQLHGVPLDLYRQKQKVIIALYALCGFYVELLIAKETDTILDMKCFSSTTKLSPYLAQVCIDDITALLSF